MFLGSNEIWIFFDPGCELEYNYCLFLTGIMTERIVALVDMDCFYCQVEARLNSDLQGKPMAVVQYNAWKGGGIIAVNYEARDRGVTRHMRGDEAKRICPEIVLVRVTSVRGKADLTKYRNASREVFNVICEFSNCVLRASIDEAFIDLTEAVDKRLQLGEQIMPMHLCNTFIIGHSSKENNNEDERATGVVRWLDQVYSDVMDEGNSAELLRLALGAVIVEEMRTEIFKKTSFRCSAGIAHNKIMAKLVAGLHKPNNQTVLPIAGVTQLFSTLPVQKVRNLGGKFGNDVIEKLQCEVMADLLKFSEKTLQSLFDEKTGTWLYNIARGIDLEPVTPRLVSKSIGCCKQFRGVAALKTKNSVLHWINELANEIAERLDEDMHMNKRKAQLLTVSIQQQNKKKKSSMSRSVALLSYETEAIADIAFSAIKKTNAAPQSSDAWIPHLLFLGISVGKFTDDVIASNKTINHYFQNDHNQGPSNLMTVNNSGHDFDKFNECSTDKNCEKSNKSKTVKPNCEMGSKEDLKGESFFERYFKNNKQMPNLNGRTDAQTSSFENGLSINSQCFDGNFINDNDSVVSASTSKFDDSINQIRNSNQNIQDNSTAMTLEREINENESNLIGKSSENNFENVESKEDNVIVSPSEIFPDLNNVDKDILSMLPIQFQNKILARIMENESYEKNSSNDDNHFHFSGNIKIKDNVYQFDEMQSGSIATSNLICENDMKEATSPLTLSAKVTTAADVHSHKENSNSRKNCKFKSKWMNYKKIKENDQHGGQNPSHNKIEIFETSGNVDSSENFSQEMFEPESFVRSSCNNGTLLSTSDDVINIVESGDKCDKILPEEDKICDICQETISGAIYLQHLDHHYALKLHQLLNSNQDQQFVKNHSTKMTSGKASCSSPVKRKRGPYKKGAAADVKKKARSILSFFVQK